MNCFLMFFVINKSGSRTKRLLAQEFRTVFFTYDRRTKFPPLEDSLIPCANVGNAKPADGLPLDKVYYEQYAHA